MAYILVSFTMPIASEAASCSPPSEIHFARGSWTSTVSDAIARGDIACWTVQARRGQSIHVRITSPEQNAVFQIYRPGWTIGDDQNSAPRISGTTMVRAGDGDDTKDWAGKLGDKGRFLIVVGATRGGAPYRLNLVVK